MSDAMDTTIILLLAAAAFLATFGVVAAVGAWIIYRNH